MVENMPVTNITQVYYKYLDSIFQQAQFIWHYNIYLNNICKPYNVNVSIDLPEGVKVKGLGRLYTILTLNYT